MMEGRSAAARAGPAALVGVCFTLALSACSLIEAPPDAAIGPMPPYPPPAPAPIARAQPATHDEVRAALIRWFRAHGYRAPQIGALVAYVQMESNFNPCITNGSTYRYSFQWSGVRLRRLAEFTGTNGCPAVEKQFAFADHELRTEPNYACFFEADSPTAALAALRRGFGYGRC